MKIEKVGQIFKCPKEYSFDGNTVIFSIILELTEDCVTLRAWHQENPNVSWVCSDVIGTIANDSQLILVSE